MCACVCNEWRVWRWRRDRPVPLPAPGIQLVNLSHVEDLADMLARVPGNDAAKKQQFNLASGRAITHEGDAPTLLLFHTMRGSESMSTISTVSP